MKMNFTKLGLASVLVVTMVGCAVLDSGSDVSVPEVGADEQAAGQPVAAKDKSVAGAQAPSPRAVEENKLADGELATRSRAEQVVKSEETEPEDNQLSDEILGGETDEGAGSETEYLNCNGWAAGGRRCNVQCLGLPWLYTGWSYPKITNGECNAKASQFCWDHGSLRIAACWGT